MIVSAVEGGRGVCWGGGVGGGLINGSQIINTYFDFGYNYTAINVDMFSCKIYNFSCDLAKCSLKIAR